MCTDIFVVNQHQPATHDSKWFAVEFAKAIQSIGHTLLVLQPWNSPLALKRAWCLWEILSTLKCGMPLDILLCPKESSSFKMTLMNDFHAITASLCKVDTREAGAWSEDDRKMIAEAVEGSPGGFLAVNKTLMDGMREWVTSSSQSLLLELRASMGDKHPDVLRCMNNLGLLLHEQRKFDESEPLLRGAFEGSREVLGEQHRDTLRAANGLANSLLKQWRLSEAEALFQQVLQVQRQLGSERRGDLLQTLSNLGRLCCDSGRLEDGAALLSEAVQGRRESLGSNHALTLFSIYSLGEVKVQQGKLSEAEVLLRESLDGNCRHVSETHPNTLKAFSSLGRLMLLVGRYDEAEQLLRKALEGRRKSLGDSNPDSLKAQEDFDSCLALKLKKLEVNEQP